MPSEVIAYVIATVIVLVGLVAEAAVPDHAEAWSGGCSGPRCTLYLNANESRAFAYGNWLPRTASVRVNAVIAVGAWGLRAVGRQWIAHNYRCLAYRISLLPWEGQGLTGYRC